VSNGTVYQEALINQSCTLFTWLTRVPPGRLRWAAAPGLVPAFVGASRGAFPRFYNQILCTRMFPAHSLVQCCESPLTSRSSRLRPRFVAKLPPRPEKRMAPRLRLIRSKYRIAHLKYILREVVVLPMQRREGPFDWAIRICCQEELRRWR